MLGLGKLVTECLRSVEMIYPTLAFVTTPVFLYVGYYLAVTGYAGLVRFIASALPSTGRPKRLPDQPDGFTVQQRAERYYYDAGARDYLYASGSLSVCCVTGNYGVLRIPWRRLFRRKKSPLNKGNPCSQRFCGKEDQGTQREA